MRSLPPYADTLGITLDEAEGAPLYRMPFGDAVLGRPGFLHGGAIAGLLELAAIGTVFRALEEGNAAETVVKPINVSIIYMRGGVDHDTFASATITRLGSRVANVEAHAWQDDRTRPIASAQINLLVRRPAAQ
jgi:uncharacterized protein (TIGR00369 family)